MTRPTIEIAQISTAHKVSVGLLVATATLVVVSVAAAAIYTAVANSQSTGSIVVAPPSKTEVPLDPTADRVLSTTP